MPHTGVLPKNPSWPKKIFEKNIVQRAILAKQFCYQQYIILKVSNDFWYFRRQRSALFPNRFT